MYRYIVHSPATDPRPTRAVGGCGLHAMVDTRHEVVELVAAADGDAEQTTIVYRRDRRCTLLVVVLLLCTLILGWSALSARRGASPVVLATAALGPLGAPRMRSLLSADGVGWRVRNANDSIDVPATVPGVVHEALLAARFLANGDPLYRFNELNYRWVALESAKPRRFEALRNECLPPLSTMQLPTMQSRSALALFSPRLGIYRRVHPRVGG